MKYMSEVLSSQLISHELAFNAVSAAFIAASEQAKLFPVVIEGSTVNVYRAAAADAVAVSVLAREDARCFQLNGCKRVHISRQWGSIPKVNKNYFWPLITLIYTAILRRSRL
ncbi:hypothetical protein [Moritella yayanosii]|uniref:Uncharacterized protein n=1 Tax=Moritella yayanosii TaxID=69539 RepID=A0A330LP83_9GAMM|nr:hypothetical protein [Moritella yayanosii]SQD78016.1 protein of unknown function, might belong to Ornithine cyclodeaminase [Moritella yayanosii]